MSFYLYLAIIISVTTGTFLLNKSRVPLVGTGLTMISLGFLWLYLKMIPGRLLPDILGTEALAAGWITVLCGVALLFLKPGRH